MKEEILLVGSAINSDLIKEQYRFGTDTAVPIHLPRFLS